MCDASQSGFVGIRERIASAAARAGRSPEAIVLVGASKRQPIERLRSAYAAGLRDFGENRVQEAAAKAPLLPDDITWHLIGPLQSNKVKRAVELFPIVHSVDRPKIARALARQAGLSGKTLDVFLEVNIAAEQTKHGFEPEAALSAAEEIATLEVLRLRGLMAMPPAARDPEESRPWFARLRRLSERLEQRLGPTYGGALSMGMSGDFEVAIEEGATHVRVGTALFGAR